MTVKTPDTVVKHAAKFAIELAPKKASVCTTAQAMAKLSTSIAKLTERKDKINAEISALPDQRTALKADPIAVAVPAVVAQRPRSLPGLRPKMQFLSRQSDAPPRSKNIW